MVGKCIFWLNFVCLCAQVVLMILGSSILSGILFCISNVIWMWVYKDDVLDAQA